MAGAQRHQVSDVELVFLSTHHRLPLPKAVVKLPVADERYPARKNERNLRLRLTTTADFVLMVDALWLIFCVVIVLRD
ncbi:hypothetical protein DENSPDRAFT_831928 [Dentipellis sp. KUC8613]|nr:hypothetical protein DENSPDRAFT_831928 [Dentipellis sp. KUC8613]